MKLNNICKAQELFDERIILQDFMNRKKLFISNGSENDYKQICVPSALLSEVILSLYEENTLALQELGVEVGSKKVIVNNKPD